jgi:hypothetical protein
MGACPDDSLMRKKGLRIASTIYHSDCHPVTVTCRFVARIGTLGVRWSGKRTMHDHRLDILY